MSIKAILGAAVAAAALVAVSTPASAALMLGQTLQVEYLYPDSSSVYTGPFDIVGGGTGVTMAIGSNLTVTLGDDTISTSEDCSVGCSYAGASFNGFRLFDGYGTVADFTSVTLLHNDYPGFDMSRVTFDANNIYVNMQGIQFTVSPSELDFKVNGGSGAPEPAAWALMIGGFGLAGAALRRRKALAA